MPKAIQKQLPKLYSTQKELVGDKTAYARYFFPMGAYIAYLLEYDPKTRIGFGAVTMGYGWELGNMSLDEMQEVKVHGLGIERDLYFTPCKLHEIEELEDLVQGQFTKEKVQIEEAIAEEIKAEIKEDTKEQEEAKSQEEQMTPQTDIAEKISEEPAPEGVPTLTLFQQYEEKAEKRPDVEAPREMNGQTVYFDDDHHPIVESNNDQEYLLFAPKEYTLWTQEVERVSAELKANTPKKTTAKTQTKSKTNTHTTARSGKATQSTTSEPSLFDFVNEDTTLKPQPIAEVKQAFDANPRPFLSAPDSHLRDGSIVVQKGQVGYLSDLKRQPTFHPMDLPLTQITRLKAYVEIRECYHRLYDYEATNHAEDKEEREKLNRLYDNFVARWGALNKKANTDLIKMDATGVELLFLSVPNKESIPKPTSSTIPQPFQPQNSPLLPTPWKHLAHPSTNMAV